MSEAQKMLMHANINERKKRQNLFIEKDLVFAVNLE